ncbi:hypothetical protein [Streptomyces sp. NPDC004267]|uniref:hypothetical protein n=1 Tax=Streptomyces sp. NPDC004267 TaxID=3364694 RepID=UPI00369D5F24
MKLKATVGLLRRADDLQDPLEPAPGLARLPDLIDSSDRPAYRSTSPWTSNRGRCRPASA